MQTKETKYKLPWGREITIPAGLPVFRATNLPADCEIKWWVSSLTDEMSDDEEIESHHRNIGFGLTENEVRMNGPFKYVKEPFEAYSGMSYSDVIRDSGNEIVAVLESASDEDCQWIVDAMNAKYGKEWNEGKH